VSHDENKAILPKKIRHRLRRVQLVVLAREPQVVVRVGKPERIRTLDHPRQCLQRTRIHRKSSLARFVLAAPNRHGFVEQINVSALKVCDFYAAHRRVQG